MDQAWLKELNEQQRAAATFGDGPLLIIAGAGTGKTKTLAHRVACLISRGVSPGRILLLTFTRRAAAEMLRRVEGILRGSGLGVQGLGGGAQGAVPGADVSRVWGGTFHSIANRLLRTHARALGLGDAFTVIDRADAEDLMNVVRSELELDRSQVRFPRKGTCMAIYSRCVNAQEPIEASLKAHFPWCEGFAEPLKALFRAYAQRKQEQNTLDYDDLLLWWFHMMQDPLIAADVRKRFDAVLVDEYQDTNAIQAGILQQLCPDGRGLSVVGDDAQSIYSFRAATVHNILEFPATFAGATVLKLEQNYRSVQPILDAANSVIGLCPRRYNKDLFSTRASQQKPRLVALTDEDQQTGYLIGRILAHHEAGIALRRQAVLFRAAHHSDALEVELARHNIPFVKYGGLKFLEAAHVKDALALLRLAENPRDSTSAFRVLQLLDGIGPGHARKAVAHLARERYDLNGWRSYPAPAAASGQWPAFTDLLVRLSADDLPLSEQISAVRRFYGPILERRYEQPQIRARDLEQLEQISSNFASRGAMLAELALDPPSSTQDLAGPPLMEEDYLILSTIHSAKGCEWDAVYIIHASDGNIPSDMATGSPEQIEEERRLLYVAMTRARDFLEVCFPLKYYRGKWKMGDRHSYAQLTRFVPQTITDRFERVSVEAPPATGAAESPVQAAAANEIRAKIASMWS
jgi:DNA helicase-2/ATP-dependent DNA helicase PcrA